MKALPDKKLYQDVLSALKKSETDSHNEALRIIEKSITITMDELVDWIVYFDDNQIIRSFVDHAGIDPIFKYSKKFT